MSHLDREKLKELFADAVELPAAERSAYVSKACLGDSDLEKELISLLDANDSTRNLIEENVIDLSKQISEKEQDLTGKRFGNYRIVREIGHGGMGTVFLARRDDGEFDQDVALKLVRQSIADSLVIERFRRERQILAGLNHPNIAALHDGGISDRGEPFIAMEYVDGMPLTEYAAENKLSIEERLRLFVKVCSAVAYAHRNLVVHRDIKPSNILITAGGEPKLLDFGLAKAFESDSSLTQTAVRAFTPAYASPEQITGKNITTASDIYSLGVVFYELLTGSKPLDLGNKSFDEVLQTINTSQPVPPSLIPHVGESSVERRALKGDLDNIALMALRKEPDRRYRSVEDFAADIERQLDGRPVAARPNTLGYRSGKFLRRHKIGVAAGTLVILSIITGIVFTLWQANVARRERDRAEKRFQDVRQLSNSLLFEIAPKIERLQGSTEARELLVVRALVYLDSLAAETQGDTVLQSELADAYQKIGDLQGNPRRPNLSDFAGAIESYLKSRAILEKLPQSSDNRRRLAWNYRELASIRFAQSEIKESIADSERSLELFASLLAEVPDSADLAKAYAATLLDYGHTHSINNQYAIAIPIYREAIAKIAQMDRSDAEVLRLLALGTSYLSNALSWDSQQAEAEIENEKAVQFARELQIKYPADPDIQKTVYAVYTLASSNFESIKNDVSLKFAEITLNVARRSSEADPADTQARQNLAKALSRYGIILVLLKKNGHGFENLRAAESEIRELIAREPRNRVYQDDLGTLYTRFGDAEKMRSNLPGALEAYKNSAEIFKNLAASDEKNTVAQRDWAQAVKSVGVTEIKLGQKVEARASLNLAIQIVDRLKQQNALGKWDEKIFNEMHPLLAKLDE
ncbi:MAG: serine/threonine protein kinase [Pyrinomonadaceae bacterium]|nr:serine/threonine protein kinase [Acidobacteriota bacterium]MBP7375942.1 serine/threonine protein kinase [Pyrinomonadaceae bacterium]